MKSLTLLVFFFLVGIFHTFSQNYTNDFGKYTNDELQMHYYDKDSTAEAVAIYDIGKSYFNLKEGGFELIFERRIKIKIFSKAGIDWSEFEIPYYEENSKTENILEIEGNTYNYENGTVRTTSLDLKNTFIEKQGNNWMIKKFAMPDVKEGSLIEVNYKISSPFFFNFRSWTFQKKIPVIYSEYTTKMIPIYTYRYILQGAANLNEIKKYSDSATKKLAGYSWQDKIYIFSMNNIPAFRDESFISVPKDYIIKMDFQLSEYINSLDVKQEVMTTWPKFIKELLDESTFGGYVKSSQRLAKEIIDTMQLTSKSTGEKAQKIFDFVKSNYSWGEKSDKITSKSVKEFLQSKVGNSADINLFLVGMLNACGVEAYPVIISTRGHGKIKYDYPFRHFFNYTIVLAIIDGQRFLLDATEPLCSFGMLPTRCLNDKGLVIKKGDEAEWENFSSAVFSSVTCSFDLYPSITSDSVNGNYKIISTGYDALNYRKMYLRNISEFKNEVLLSNLVLNDSIIIENQYQIEKPFSVVFKVSSSKNIVDDKILISPFCGYVINVNPFKQIGRTYPIDILYKKRRIYMSTIHIPQGYRLLSLPENLTVDNNDVKIIYKIEVVDEGLVRVTGIYDFKNDIYSSSKYLVLKKYYSTIIEKFNQQLIFEKM